MTDFTKVDEIVESFVKNEITFGETKEKLHTQLEEAVRETVEEFGKWAYGERCEVFEEDCAVCDGWKPLDDYLDSLKKIEEK